MNYRPAKMSKSNWYNATELAKLHSFGLIYGWTYYTRDNSVDRLVA